MNFRYCARDITCFCTKWPTTLLGRCQQKRGHRRRKRKVSTLAIRECVDWCASCAASDNGPHGPAVALAHERLYLEKLPSASMYERSYMHRDVVTHVSVTRWVPSAALLIACRA